MMVYVLKCEACKIIIEGITTIETCPKCQQTPLKVIASYPKQEENAEQIPIS